MGVTAGLIRYPAGVLAEVKARETFYPPNGKDIQQCFLDRSWDELYPALRTFGPLLSLTLSGDYGFDGGLDSFGWDESNGSSPYLAFVSPPLIAEIAVRLRSLTFERLAEQFTEPSRGTNYLAPRFRELVQFYTDAALDGECVFIHVA